MRSKLFEADRLTALAEARHLGEFFRRLLPRAAVANHLEFEHHLLGEHLVNLDRVLRYLRGDMAALWEWLLVRYQLDNLRVALRCHLAGGDRRAAEALMAPLPAWLALPLDDIFAAPNLRRVAALLPTVEFATALERLAATPPPGGLDTFAIEMTLDHAYYEKLAHLGRARRLTAWTRRLVAYDVDASNLVALARARLYTSRPYEEIKPFLVWSELHFREAEAQALYAAADWPAALAHSVAPLMPVPPGRSWSPSPTDLEEALRVQQYRLAVRAFAESMLDIAAVVAYYYIKRVELTNLVRVTEGIRHALPREQITAQLVATHR